ncbi:hypothetical protein AAG906_031728 [Vitis piasezkii]
MASAVFIPDDVVFEILVRLPVQSLLRSRCVCKLWRRIISDSSFIELHRTHSLTRSDGNFLLFSFPDGSTNSRKHKRINLLERPQTPILQPKHQRVCDAAALKIKPPRIMLLIGLRLLQQHLQNLEGFDNLSAREAVTVDSYYFPVLKYLRSICVRGSLYWDHALLDEGLAEERFRLVPPPAGVPQYSSLAQLDGRLAMVNYRGLISGDTIPMWVLEDDQNGVWSMKQRIVFSSILNDARLGLQGIPPKYFHLVPWNAEGYMLHYNLELKSFRVQSFWKPKERGLPLWTPIVINYVESLVPLREIMNSYRS